MAFKILVIAGAVVSSVVHLGGAVELNQPLVVRQDIESSVSAAEKTKLCSDSAVSADYKKQIGCAVGDPASNSTQSNSNNPVTTNTATNTLKLFRSQPSTHETPKVFGARMDDLKAREEAKKRREAAEAADLQKTGSDGFGLMRLLEIAVFAAFVMCPLMLTPMGRNALIAAGVVSADSEITKMSIKASGGLAAQMANFPLVEQALAAMGIMSQGKNIYEESGMEMHRNLINDSDGDSEDEAEIIVDLGNLSRPMNNRVERQTDDFDPNALVSTLPQQEIVIDIGSAPQQQQDLLKYDDLINIDYQNGDFATDDFFDEDDDF